jgi:hypothetical protein
MAGAIVGKFLAEILCGGLGIGRPTCGNQLILVIMVDDLLFVAADAVDEFY